MLRLKTAHDASSDCAIGATTHQPAVRPINQASSNRVFRAIALQVSGTMAEPIDPLTTRLDMARLAVRSAMWNLGKKTGARCGLIEFSEDASVVVRRQFPTSWTAHLTVDGATCDPRASRGNLASALDAAVGLFDGLPEDIRVQCHIVTDGALWVDESRITEIGEDLRDMHATVSMLHLGGDNLEALRSAAAIVRQYVPVRVASLDEYAWSLQAFQSATCRALGGRMEAAPEYLRRAFNSIPGIPVTETADADVVPAAALSVA